MYVGERSSPIIYSFIVSTSCILGKLDVSTSYPHGSLTSILRIPVSGEKILISYI